MLSHPKLIKLLIIFTTNTMAACIKCPSDAKRLSLCKLIELWMFNAFSPPPPPPKNHKIHKHSTSTSNTSASDDQDDDEIWSKIRVEAFSNIQQDPSLADHYSWSVLFHGSLELALANQLATKLGNKNVSAHALTELFISILTAGSDRVMIEKAIREDLKAVKDHRDPACSSYLHCLLDFKGFLACQAHRISHKLWKQGRISLALFIQSRVSEVFGLDIHPGAKIGSGIVFDHATGPVIGETAEIGDNVTILHNVTLGGTGKAAGDRHPKVEDQVFIGAGATVLGNIRVGSGAKIGAGAMVLKDVPCGVTVVGNPSRFIAHKEDKIVKDGFL